MYDEKQFTNNKSYREKKDGDGMGFCVDSVCFMAKVNWEFDLVS
jgi:hypothetical protein